MKNSLILSGLAAGLAAAAPAPAPQSQGIDFAVIAAANIPAPTGAPVAATVLSAVPTYSTASAVASAVAAPVVSSESKVKRQDPNACSAQPVGAGPTTSPDTAQAFVNNQVYNTAGANAPTPQGYSLSFENLEGSVSASTYMGYYTLDSYDTIKCSEYCDAADGCLGFNVFFERDPSLDPAAACPNPASTVMIKCTLWGTAVSSTQATNEGQWRENFQVVIAGSNGYSSNTPPAAIAGYDGPSNRLGGAIQAPGQYYLGAYQAPSVYDPSICAAKCDSWTGCEFFNAYVDSENNNPLGTYCAFYTQSFDRSYATNTLQYDQAGNEYTVSSSYTYSKQASA